MSGNLKDIEKELLGIKFFRFDVNTIKRHYLAEKIDKKCEQKLKEMEISSLFDPDVTDVVYLAYPYVSDPQLLYYMVIMVLYVFNIDDSLDDQKYPNSKDNWKNYLREKICPGESKAEKIFLLMIEEGRKCLTEEQLDVINDKLIKYVCCAPTIHKVINNDLKFTDEEFLNIRLFDLAVYPFQYTYAFGFGITVEQLDNNKVCQQMMSEAIKDVGIANDLYSLRKEVLKGLTKWNYIYIKMQNHNVSAQTAVDMLMKEMDVAKQNALTHASQLKATTQDKSMHDFADAIENVMDGHRYWCWMCRRYNGIHLYQ